MTRPTAGSARLAAWRRSPAAGGRFTPSAPPHRSSAAARRAGRTPSVTPAPSLSRAANCFPMLAVMSACLAAVRSAFVAAEVAAVAPPDVAAVAPPGVAPRASRAGRARQGPNLPG